MTNLSSTRGSLVLERVRDDILGGRWTPGTKLQPVTLAELYGSSTTVMRESLTKLAGEKLIRIVPNRGFFVPELSLAELRDLTEVRCMNEAYALKLAIQRGDVDWEAELTAAHHQLSRAPRRVQEDPTHVSPAWASAHRRFHAKLVEASKVPVLVDLSRQLADATELYRRWAAPSPTASSRDVEKEHAEILEAVLARDADQAAALLCAHYRRTVEVVLRSGLVPEVDTSPSGLDPAVVA